MAHLVLDACHVVLDSVHRNELFSLTEELAVHGSVRHVKPEHDTPTDRKEAQDDEKQTPAGDRGINMPYSIRDYSSKELIHDKSGQEHGRSLRNTRFSYRRPVPEPESRTERLFVFLVPHDSHDGTDGKHGSLEYTHQEAEHHEASSVLGSPHKRDHGSPAYGGDADELADRIPLDEETGRGLGHEIAKVEDGCD
jgi:hypothetical protein